MSSEQRFVGDYELFQKLGEGGMGEVYLARHVASEEVVALKLAKRELLATSGGLALFRQQGRTESALQHPNILHVQGAGTHEGQPYLVMPLMEGGTLAEDENLARLVGPVERLQLVLTIARAVQFAHERGVLHCDLKHDNILFNAVHEPKVSDFGLARAIGASGTAVEEGARGGTRGWMSPEQLTGDALTTASDVFALGVMLHWVTVGELPFGSKEDFERRVLETTPPPLRSWTPGLEWGLLAVAHRALQKEAKRRYHSAAAFAADLERLERGEAIRGSPIPFWGRAFHWAHSHPGARKAIFLLLPCFALAAFFVWRSQREDLRGAVLDMNAYAAGGQAAAVLFQLKEYADVIERAADDPAVKALVRGPRRVSLPPQASAAAGNPCTVQTALEDDAPLRRHAARFSTMVVLDEDGCGRARVSEESPSPTYVQQRFEWRDYFGGARAEAVRGMRKPYVRKAYRSSVSQLVKFALSTPLFDGDRWIGVLTGSITVTSALELPRTRRSKSGEQMTVLIGPFEGDEPPSTEPKAPQFTFLAHPKLKRGAKKILDPELAAQLDRAFPASPQQFELPTAPAHQRPDYTDPFLGERWLAAFAPVGATGYVVIVQTRDAAATRPINLLLQLAIGLAVAFGASFIVWHLFLLWRFLRERRPLPPIRVDDPGKSPAGD